MSIKKIFLDLDDVLVDCTTHAMRHMGLQDYDIVNYPLGVGRDICEAYHRETGIHYSPPLWWEHFKREWWATMPPNEGAYCLISEAASLVGRENVAILTSPTKCGDCLAGKLDWIQQYMPQWLQRQYIMTPRKWFCATAESLLIDDAEENLQSFSEAGGYVITYPRPWNNCRDYTMAAHRFVMEDLTKLQSCGMF